MNSMGRGSLLTGLEFSGPAIYLLPMIEKPKPKPDDPEQSKRFIEMAREIGAAESEEGANRALRKLDLKRIAPKPQSPKKA